MGFHEPWLTIISAAFSAASGRPDLAPDAGGDRRIRGGHAALDRGAWPLEALKDPDGRERVEALLNQFERAAGSKQVPTSPEVFAALRLRLGLKSRI